MIVMKTFVLLMLVSLVMGVDRDRNLCKSACAACRHEPWVTHPTLPCPVCSKCLKRYGPGFHWDK